VLRAAGASEGGVSKPHSHRCEIHKYDFCRRDEEYDPCREPAHYVDDDAFVCERHCRVAIGDGREVTDLEGETVELDDDGEIVRAA
jgi:hypothetical protein